MGKKYIVQPGASYAANGRVYAPGDELDGDIFKNPDALKFALGGKAPKLKEAPATPLVPLPAVVILPKPK